MCSAVVTRLPVAGWFGLRQSCRADAQGARGTVSNRDADGGPGKPIEEGGLGYSCIAEQHTVEVLRHGNRVTPFLKFGDKFRIEMCDPHGCSIFGAIEQDVVRYVRS